MSSRRIKRKIVEQVDELGRLTGLVPEGCFVTSHLLENNLPVFPESHEYSEVMPLLGERGIDPESVTLLARGEKVTGRRGGYLEYQVFMARGAPVVVKLPRERVSIENNIFHHPETLVQTLLPHTLEKPLKQVSNNTSQDVRKKSRIDYYFKK
jgi:hypothetical protein